MAVTSMEAVSMASAMDSTAAAATLAAVSSNASAAASTELSSTDVVELSSTVAIALITLRYRDNLIGVGATMPVGLPRLFQDRMTCHGFSVIFDIK